MRNFLNNSKETFQLVLVFSLLLIVCLFFTSCGFRDSLRINCRMEKTACDTLFGREAAEQTEVSTIKSRVDYIEKEVETLKTVLDGQISSVQLLASQVQTNETLIMLLQSSVSDNTDAIEALMDANQTLVNNIAYQQTVINNHQVELNNLATEDTVVEYYDPCGTKANAFNEVLLKTRSGKTLAYFESGSNRFLTLLTPGSYRTTDGTNCYFNLNANGTITNERY